MKNNIKLIIGASILLAVTGCRPYHKPVYEQVSTEETAFVIPLEGDTKNQARYDSEAHFQEMKVATKRILIPHRWNKTGRIYWQGNHIPLVKVVKVSRSPVTRLWEGDVQDGQRVGAGIWVESADSIGFSMGFNCTALIREEDTAKFLYWYKGSQLASVMDTEIKARYQQAAADVAARYNMDELRAKKNEIVSAIKDDVIPFFNERGITITSVGMFGGLLYEDEEIQESINEVFVAQQEKQVAKAQLEAQNDKNERIEMEALATAEKERREAQGKADARITIAKAEANAITLVNDALNQSGEALLELKRIEVEKDRVQKWDGVMPRWLMGEMEGSGLLISTPAE